MKFKPIKRVAQRDWDHGDCGIACIAMLAGVSYKDALAAFRKLGGKKATTKVFGTVHKDIQEMLLSLGVITKQIRFKSMREIEGHAIVAVNRRKLGGWHWVVLDGGRPYAVVHDPKPWKREMVRDFRGLKGYGNYISLVA
jgi:ABC-type bacteriocin/lantibiotic exporter with double-glycine peptidase domain